MKFKILPAALVLAISASFVSSQTAHPIATGHEAKIGSDLHPVGEAMPQPTELQLLKIENIELKLTILSQTIQSIDEMTRKLPSEREATKKEQDALSAEYSALIRKIESEHPGFRWDPAHRTLAAIPTPAKPAPQEKGK